METGKAARKTVSRNAKTAGVNLTMAEERKAKEVLEARIKDRGKTAARAVGTQSIARQKSSRRRAAAAVGNAPAKKNPS
jgi:cobyric acid synthase